MTQVDHGVGDSLHPIMMGAMVLESQQQSLKFVFPCKNSFNGAESLFKNSFVKEALTPSFSSLSAALIFIDIRYHARIKDHLAIALAIIGAIKTHNRVFQ